MSQSSFQGFISPRPNKGGTNTGNATATAGDLGSGKIAYGKLGKLIGTGANFGNASVGDVINGKSFSSANGTLINGTGANAKIYATGTISASAANNITFYDNTNTGILSYYVDISGISFPPGIDTVLLINNSVSGDFVIFSSHNLLGGAFPCKIKDVANGKWWQNISGVQITTTRILMPVNSSTQQVYTWYALGL